ncbi:MAG: hypothetical protein J5814_03730 [Bacteroidaceae bacterium]|nr:hypothetical protein [Bacteroidaceae bacterium]
MEAGGQLDDARTLASLEAHHDARSQAMRVAQLSIGNQGIVVGHADAHRLAGEVPGAVGLDIRCTDAQRECHRNNHRRCSVVHVSD